MHELDLKNGNNFWVKSIEKQMTNVGIAFEILEEDKSAPVGWSKESGRLIFGIKMYFTRKAQWVWGDHLSVNPIVSTYAIVASRDSVRISFT